MLTNEQIQTLETQLNNGFQTKPFKLVRHSAYPDEALVLSFNNNGEDEDIDFDEERLNNGAFKHRLLSVAVAKYLGLYGSDVESQHIERTNTIFASDMENENFSVRRLAQAYIQPIIYSTISDTYNFTHLIRERILRGQGLIFNADFEENQNEQVIGYVINVFKEDGNVLEKSSVFPIEDEDWAEDIKDTLDDNFLDSIDETVMLYMFATYPALNINNV